MTFSSRQEGGTILKTAVGSLDFRDNTKLDYAHAYSHTSIYSPEYFQALAGTECFGQA